MVKRKRTKGQTMIYKTTHRKLKIELHEEDFEDTKRVNRTVTRRRIDNTMVKRKRIKGQTMIYKTLHRKLKIELHEERYEDTKGGNQKL